MLLLILLALQAFAWVRLATRPVFAGPYAVVPPRWKMPAVARQGKVIDHAWEPGQRRTGVGGPVRAGARMSVSPDGRTGRMAGRVLLRIGDFVVIGP